MDGLSYLVGTKYLLMLFPAVAALDGGGHRTGRETMRIVIADDHETYRRGLARAIRRFGTLDLVGEAADGAEALQVIREVSPDIALLDVRMPGLDGLEVARRLKELGGITVVLLTGQLHRGAAARCGGGRRRGPAQQGPGARRHLPSLARSALSSYKAA